MTYEREQVGRVGDEASELGSTPSAAAFWTFAAVEERLVEAMRLWWRSPGGGKWPFAADAPWHLMTRRTRIAAGELKGRELQLHMQAEDADEVKRREGRDEWGPLTRDDVARRDEASEWLTWIDGDARKVLIAALVQLAAGRERIDWHRVKASVGVEIGNKGVYRRFTRSIGRIAKRLNGAAA
jgi:hypothetical protein